MCRYGAAELHAVAAFIGESLVRPKYRQSSFSMPFAFFVQEAAGASRLSFWCLNILLCVSWYFSGGCAAQEVIKLITKQYVPLDNTFIFNSVTSTTATLRL